MKIVFISREGYDLPGARVRCYNFSRELSRYGIDTEVLSFSDSLGAKDGAREAQMGLGDKMKFNYLAFRKIFKQKDTVLYLQRFNYHSFAPYLAHLLQGNKLILDLDDWEMRENPKYYCGIYPSSKAHYLTQKIAKKSIFCVAASRFLEEFLQQSNKKVYYIPSGVDTEMFKPSLNGLKEDEIILSWVGTFHKKEYIENIKFALDCFAALRKSYSHIYFDIIGDGIYRDVLEKIVKTFEDSHVRLKGWIVPEDVPEYLKTMYIGLLPVVSDNKFNRAKSPTKLFEYMAMAKPVVASAIGEANNIIEDGANGFLAKTKDEFIKKIQVLIENRGLRRQMGEKARETVEKKYSLNVLGQDLYNLVKAV